MKETGIIMSGNHPKLILEGLKTMTRRVIKPQPVHVEVCSGEVILYKDHDNEIAWKYQVGDRLWVKETWRVGAEYDALGISGLWNHPVVGYKDEINVSFLHGTGKWRPSIFMPRWASRILLEITEVRTERLQEITVGDAKREGIIEKPEEEFRAYVSYPIIERFKSLWDSLNAKRGFPWDGDWWVWAISFRTLK